MINQLWKDKPQNVPDEARELARALNPVLGYYDPLGLASADFWGQGRDATYGWIRQAEIKHGRVAMAAFVGFCVQANGIHWPFDLVGGGVPQPFYAEGLTPPEQWDALPYYAKAQIVLFVGFLEWWSEFAPEKHYMRGGKPGEYPPFNPELYGKKGYSIAQSPNPFPVPSLYQPYGDDVKNQLIATKTKMVTEEDKYR